MADFLNKYSTEAAYSAAEHGENGSEVSLVTATNSVKYDGVNVPVARPKPGDAVYVPASCIYSAASVPAGTAEGSVTFIAGETLKTDSSNGYCPEGRTDLRPVGVVGAVHGRKALVLWKSSTKTKWAEDATSASFSIPADVLSAENYAKVYAPTLVDAGGRVGLRQTVSVDVLAAWLTGHGDSSGAGSWNGGASSEGEGSFFYTLAEWLGTDTGKVPTSAEYAAFEVEPSTPTEAGWYRYLESRRMAKPSRYTYQQVVLGKSKAATAVLASVNATQGRAYFPVAQYACDHHASYGSYGDFYNVEGLRHGDWYMMGMDEMAEVFLDIRYSLSGYGVTSDPFNRTLSRMGGMALELNRNDDACCYWCPFLRSRALAWSLANNGHLSFNNYLSYSRRVVSCSLLTY